MTCLGHHVNLTWGQILTLTFQGHSIHVAMRLDEANTMVSKSFLYHFKDGRYHRKTVSLKNAVFDLSWPLTPKPLVLGEIWRHLSERAFQELSIAFLNFDVAVTGTEIMRIIWSHVTEAVRFPYWTNLNSKVILRSATRRNKCGACARLLIDQGAAPLGVRLEEDGRQVEAIFILSFTALLDHGRLLVPSPTAISTSPWGSARFGGNFWRWKRAGTSCWTAISQGGRL